MSFENIFEDFCDFMGWDSVVNADFEGVAVYFGLFVVSVGEAGYISVEDLEVADGYDVVADCEDLGVVYGDFLYYAFDVSDTHVVFDFEGSCS